MRRLRRRLHYLWHRRRLEGELQEEMRIHRDMMRDERKAAFGSDLRLQEEARDVWGWSWLDQIQQDLVFAVRQLRNAPGFTLTAITVLAVGVGLNLAVFHAVKAVLFDRLPVAEADSLLRIVRQSPERERWAFPPEAAAFYQEHADLFAVIVAERVGVLPVRVNDDDEDARAQFVSGGYFEGLGIVPGRGRLLAAHDDRREAPLVAVLSDGYWRRRFAADPSIVSSTLQVNGRSVLVAGIAPAGFTGLAMSRGDLWLTTAARTQLFDVAPGDALFGEAEMGLVGRLRPAVTRERASVQIQSVTADLRRQWPGMLDEDEFVRARLLADDDRNQGPFLVFPVLVGLVLLASCANLGNMLLARGLGRRREIDTRMAVGAGRARLVRQLMTESLLVAALGGLAGLVVGGVGARLLAATFAQVGASNAPVALDLPVLLAAIALSLASALAFGLAPALQITSRRGAPTRARQILMAVQVAVSCVLLVGAGAMVRGAQRQTALASARDYASLVVVSPDLARANLTGAAARQVLDGIATRLRQLPEVAAATVSADPIFGPVVAAAPGLPVVLQSSVDPEYFGVMALDIVRGRTLRPGDGDVAVLGAAAARRAFGDDPLGQVWNPGGETTGPLVVGVVEDSALAALRDPRAVEVYVPLTAEGVGTASVIVQTTGEGREVLRRARDIASLPNAPASAWLIQTRVDQLLTHALAATRLIGVLGLAAAALAALGIFGLLAFSVRERTRELAIRIALGASAVVVASMLMGRYARPLGLGIVTGAIGAIAGERVLLGLRLGLGLTGFDPVGYLLGLILFMLTAVVAIAVPVGRAWRIDPGSALRCE